MIEIKEKLNLGNVFTILVWNLMLPNLMSKYI